MLKTYLRPLDDSCLNGVKSNYGSRSYKIKVAFIAIVQCIYTDTENCTEGKPQV